MSATPTTNTPSPSSSSSSSSSLPSSLCASVIMSSSYKSADFADTTKFYIVNELTKWVLRVDERDAAEMKATSTSPTDDSPTSSNGNLTAPPVKSRKKSSGGLFSSLIHGVGKVGSAGVKVATAAAATVGIEHSPYTLVVAPATGDENEHFFFIDCTERDGVIPNTYTVDHIHDKNAKTLAMGCKFKNKDGKEVLYVLGIGPVIGKDGHIMTSVLTGKEAHFDPKSHLISRYKHQRDQKLQVKQKCCGIPDCEMAHLKPRASVGFCKDEPRNFVPTSLFKWRLETDFSSFMDALVQPLIYSFEEQIYEKQRNEKKEEILSACRSREIQSLSTSPSLRIYSGDITYNKIWTDEGIGAKQQTSVWRAQVPAGCVIFGDYAHASRKPPTEKILACYDHPTAFRKPNQFLLLYVKEKGKRSFYAWVPHHDSTLGEDGLERKTADTTTSSAASEYHWDEYVALGHVITTTPTPPNPMSSEFSALRVVHRLYCKDWGKSVSEQVWTDRGTGGMDGAFYKVPAPYNYLLVSGGTHKPPMGTYHTLLSSSEKPETCAIARPITSLRSLDYAVIWADKNMVASSRDSSAWSIQPPEGYVRLGDYMNNDDIKPTISMVVIKDHPGCARPKEYQLVCKRTRGVRNMFIWRPVPHQRDYYAMGCVVTDDEIPPSIDYVRCVNRSMLIPYEKFTQLFVENNQLSKDIICWRHSDLSTFEMTTGTHHKPTTGQYFTFPPNADAHAMSLNRLQQQALDVCQQCTTQLEKSVGKLPLNNFTSMTLTPAQTAKLIQTLNSIISHVSTEQTTPMFGLSQQFMTQVMSYQSKLNIIKAHLLRYIFQEISKTKTDHQFTVIKLNAMWPLIQQIPNIDWDGDRVNTWNYRPRNFRGSKPTGQLIFDLVGEEIAMRFFQMEQKIESENKKSEVKQVKNDDDDDGGELATLLADEIEGLKLKPKAVLDPQPDSIPQLDVTSLLKGLRGLSHDLDIVTDNTEEMELRRLYVERYNHYFVSVVKSKINIARVSSGECLLVIQWISWYIDLVTELLENDPAAASRVISDLESLSDEYVDAHARLSKERILKWIGNIISNEQKAIPELDDQGYYTTPGPADLYLNLNNLFDSAATALTIGGRALARVALMHSHVLTYYQQTLKRFLATATCVKSTSTSKDKDGKTDYPIKIGPLMKSSAYILAQINNAQQYEDNTDEYKDHVLAKLNDCSQSVIEDMETEFETVKEGYFDVAVSCVDILCDQIRFRLADHMTKLFTHQWYTTPTMLKSIMDELNDIFDEYAGGIARESFRTHLVVTTYKMFVDTYLLAYLNNTKTLVSGRQALSLDTTWKRVESDRREMESFFSQFSQIKKDVAQAKMEMLQVFQELTLGDEGFISIQVKIVVDKFKDHKILPPAFIINTVFNLRNDISLELRKKLSTEYNLNLTQSSTSSTFSFGSSSSSNLNTSALRSTATIADPYVLEVHIDSGSNLVVKDLNSSDPYAVLKLIDGEGNLLVRRQTKTISKNLNPKWNEKFSDFSPADVAACRLIIIEVWDHDIVGQDFMGTATLKLEEIRAKRLIQRSSSLEQKTASRAPIPYTLPLGKRFASDEVGGSIQVNVAFYPAEELNQQPQLSAAAAAMNLTSPTGSHLDTSKLGSASATGTPSLSRRSSQDAAADAESFDKHMRGFEDKLKSPANKESRRLTQAQKEKDGSNDPKDPNKKECIVM